MIRRFYVGLRSTTGKLCARELSRRPHLHGDSSRLSSPPGSLSWQPVAGVSNTDPKAAPRDKYLFEELKSRLQRWPARFLLKLIKVAEDQGADCERISFNPCRLQHGIEVSGYPILETVVTRS